eukprot:CAMPEP_0116116098 /NCGR_PEP_ID=MMETSP0329-20121206/856_1 /TAXON_ID=697910 /ORGANISM="Pseudo-nitzschia arenysensis, Strain B593" /LENGTH=101 /DNA_ID=CAMNT_0003609569 /DNA_START=271 /DNA_END=576 /DNA_ORIENTATION=+
MKSYQQIALLLVAFAAVASAFAPVNTPRQDIALSMSNAPEPISEFKSEKAAAVAAFATAMAPFAANAVDEGVVIGYGAGLVACVVSLAVGFAIGYGTLVKL